MVTCEEVLRELSNFIDGDIDPRLQSDIEDHLRRCHRCSVLHDSIRKVIYIVGDGRVFEVPSGYSDRLHKFLSARMGS